MTGNAQPRNNALVRAGARVTVRQRPTPVPAAGELVVATEVAGLCGTDIQILRGSRKESASVLGHEGIATVVSVGEGIRDSFSPGDAVVINPTHPNDPGFLLGHNVDGLLQRRTLVPATATRAGLVLGLDQRPEAELAALVEPLAVVNYALRALSRFRPSTLLVVGDGTIGQLAVRSAARWATTVKRTVLVHHGESGRQWTLRSGLPPDDSLVDGEDMTGVLHDGPVGVLLATPRESTGPCLERVLRSVGDGSVIDVIGGVPPGLTVKSLPGTDLAGIRAANLAGRPDVPLTVERTATTGSRINLFGHRGVSNAHLGTAVSELVRSPERYRELITHIGDLEYASRIMSDLACGNERIAEGRRMIKLAVRMSPTCRKGND
ncbi:Alcohol dehydrogenase GroES-like domain-containing protein [Actinopolyspora alba]|uniref:Alcohol dehydrogenase GroES-like domain-containing protein n=1 Tax=Actinopolyspora alba TaxID=673379 RepID=A0A1I1Z3D6_9ACTN|nr:alcohol dehydrogenase catalytic domain-containing protein [Actinopolyspora alba]SFE26177.1 Alcohol dehydrogenase GroES-like domain-containing protein [Actinopolyspora alba]